MGAGHMAMVCTLGGPCSWEAAVLDTEEQGALETLETPGATSQDPSLTRDELENLES